MVGSGSYISPSKVAVPWGGRGRKGEMRALTLTCPSQISLASCSAMRTKAVRDMSFSSAFRKPPYGGEQETRIGSQVCPRMPAGPLPGSTGQGRAGTLPGVSQEGPDSLVFIHSFIHPFIHSAYVAGSVDKMVDENQPQPQLSQSSCI